VAYHLADGGAGVHPTGSLLMTTTQRRTRAVWLLAATTVVTVASCHSSGTSDMGVLVDDPALTELSGTWALVSSGMEISNCRDVFPEVDEICDAITLDMSSLDQPQSGVCDWQDVRVHIERPERTSSRGSLSEWRGRRLP